MFNAYCPPCKWPKSGQCPEIFLLFSVVRSNTRGETYNLVRAFSVSWCIFNGVYCFVKNLSIYGLLQLFSGLFSLFETVSIGVILFGVTCEWVFTWVWSNRNFHKIPKHSLWSGLEPNFTYGVRLNFYSWSIEPSKLFDFHFKIKFLVSGFDCFLNRKNN